MIYSLIVIFLALSSHSGEWQRVNQSTIAFEGKIESNEYSKFTAIMDKNVRTLMVNSSGGETSAAMKIGFDLRKFQIEIKVKNWCLSSCANYLFLGATRRYIDSGIVGYHGNVQACFGGDKWAETKQQLIQKGLSEKEIESFYANTKQQIKEEERFLKLVGVSQELFNITCEPDKGANDGKEYAFLLPTKETFEKYGVLGVIGSQDQDIAAKFPAPVLIN
jgi:hypothetical protein